MNVKNLTSGKHNPHNARSTPLEHADEAALASQAGHTLKGVSMRRIWNTTSRRIGSSLMVAVLTLFGLAAPAAADDQVPFTASATGVVTGVTHLPGGLTQVDFSNSGTATHLGNFTGAVTRIQDHQGNFATTAVYVGANGTDSVFFAVSGHFEEGTGGDKCMVTSTGTYTVTGGTGAFANATGSGTIDTQIDQCAGTATGTYTGTISQPNSG